MNAAQKRYNRLVMSEPMPSPQLNLAQTDDFRETYANSVQVRVSVWDFLLIFGLASSEAPDKVTIRSQNAIYLSPQQAKALWNVLGQNLAQYEQAFGELNLEPHSQVFPQGPVN
jgi:flagellar protein FlaG